MAQRTSSGYQLLKAFGWFFASLAMVALLSQPGASHDEMVFHAPSIWCGQGLRHQYCTELDHRAGSVYEAYTNIGISPCKVESDKPLVCPPNQNSWDGTLANMGLYPSGFFFLLSWFVVPSVEVSFVLLRIVSALTLSVIFFLTMKFVSLRHRLVLFLLSLSVFPSTGLFLFASINPSSWTAFGVGIGWLAIHASLSGTEGSWQRRVPLLGLGLLSWTLAVVSRIDAAPFIAFTAIVATIFELISRVHTSRKRAAVLVAISVLVVVVIAELLSPLPPIKYLGVLFSFIRDGVGSQSLITEGLLKAIPNALAALGNVPTHSSIEIPEVVYLGNLAVLIVIGARTYNSENKSQSLGVLATVFAITLASISQANLVGNRSTGSEFRYIYPLLLFAAGWWYLNGPLDLNARILKVIRPSAAIVTGCFGLWVYVIAERNVDFQTGGIRVLPEGSDQWWWSWMPIGPNIVLLLAPFFLWQYFRVMTAVLESSTERAIVT